jgi:hypothetical protein
MRIMEWETIAKDKFSTRTLHKNREGMRHPKASERIEGQPPAALGGTIAWI